MDQKVVTAIEADLAVEVLDEWNRQTGQHLGSRDWLAKIVMRIREYPDLTLTAHSDIIAAALADPWWTGAPTPSVVYGSGAQFERSLLTATDAPRIEKEPPLRFGRGLTTSEMLKRTEGLK